MFKRISLIKQFLFLLFILSFFHQAKSSLIHEQYLDLIEKEFDRTEGHQNRYLIVTRPINNEYLEKLQNFEDLDEKKLTEGLSRETEKTTPISIAVSLGKVSLVQKFLSVIDDVNSDHCLAWGYRQPYTLAHMALDPQYPWAKTPVSLEDRLMIIDILAQKNADFNRIEIASTQYKPPLIAGDSSSHEVQKIRIFLRARAILFGADPYLIEPTSHEVMLKYPDSSYKSNNLTRECLNQYLKKISWGEPVDPLPKILDHLKKAAFELGFNLEERVTELTNDLKESLALKAYNSGV